MARVADQKKRRLMVSLGREKTKRNGGGRQSGGARVERERSCARA